MLTLNETFAAPDEEHAWTVINDLQTLVPCVPGATVKSADSQQAVKAQIEVRMGAMGMTFSGPVIIESADVATQTVRIKANTRETLGQSYATGDITITLADGTGTIDAIANVGGLAAGMGEGVIINVLTDLVRGFSVNVGAAQTAPPKATDAADDESDDAEASDTAEVEAADTAEVKASGTADEEPEASEEEDAPQEAAAAPVAVD